MNDDRMYHFDLERKTLVLDPDQNHQQYYMVSGFGLIALPISAIKFLKDQLFNHRSQFVFDFNKKQIESIEIIVNSESDCYFEIDLKTDLESIQTAIKNNDYFDPIQIKYMEDGEYTRYGSFESSMDYDLNDFFQGLKDLSYFQVEINLNDFNFGYGSYKFLMKTIKGYVYTYSRDLLGYKIKFQPDFNLLVFNKNTVLCPVFFSNHQIGLNKKVTGNFEPALNSYGINKFLYEIN